MKRLFVLAVAIFLVSCASVGEKRAGLATLQNQTSSENDESYALMFVGVDGAKLKYPPFGPNKSSHYVSPGKRRLDLKVIFNTQKTKYIPWAAEYKDISVEIKEKEIYKVKATENNWCVSVEVVDSNGTVVAGPIIKKPTVTRNRHRDDAAEYWISEAYKVVRTINCQ